MRSTTFYDSGSLRRRRLLYLMCFLVTAGAAVALLLLSGPNGEKGDRKKAAKAPSAASQKEGNPPAGAAGAAAPVPEEPAAAPALGPTAKGPLARADARFDEGMKYAREAMRADAGSDEAKSSRRSALDAFEEAQRLYEAWIADHPEDADRLDDRITKLQSQLYWIRKSMSVGEFRASGPEAARPEPPAHREPPPAIPAGASTRPSPPHATEPRFDPAAEADRYLAAAARAFREGRPSEAAESGRKLLDDPRMAGQRERLAPAVAAAEEMTGFLDAARDGLAVRVNQEIRLELRKDSVTGTLLSVGNVLVLKCGEESRNVPLPDLAAGELLDRAADSGRLKSAAAHLAAGRYLLCRGDGPEAAKELLLARAAGAEIGEFRARIDPIVAKSTELKSLAAWLAVAGRLDSPDAALAADLREFRRQFGSTPLFAKHREELLAAESRAAGTTKFHMEQLYSVPVKISGRGSVHFEYPFDDPAELADWGRDGKWEIADGILTGDRGKLWLERFDLKDVDLDVTFPDGAPLCVGFWEDAWGDRQGVNLTVAADDQGLTFTLRHGDRTISEEKVRAPSGPLQIRIQKRDDKYQIRLNRKLVVKGVDHTGRQDQKLRYLGFVARGGPLAIADVAATTEIDLDWARAGGEKYGDFIETWFVTGPFAIDPKKLPVALATPHWPETRPFSPEDPGEGEDGKPAWRRIDQRGGWLDLNRLFKPNDRVGAYAAARVWSPEKRAAILEVSADDTASAFLDGDLALREVPLREPVRVPVHLKAGDNTLLVKVLDVKAGWWLRARLLTKDGEPMPDVIAW